MEKSPQVTFNSKSIMRRYAKEYWLEFLRNQKNCDILLQQFEDFLKKQKKERVFAFYPIHYEPPIWYLLDKYFRNIYIPVIDPSNNKMKFSAFKLNESYLETKRNFLNILEPIQIIEEIPQKDDLVIIPSLGTNRHFARLGRGAGYYDRYFNENKKSLESIKISLLPEKLTNLVFIQENHDLILDIIITENNIVYK